MGSLSVGAIGLLNYFFSERIFAALSNSYRPGPGIKILSFSMTLPLSDVDVNMCDCFFLACSAKVSTSFIARFELIFCYVTSYSRVLSCFFSLFFRLR